MKRSICFPFFWRRGDPAALALVLACALAPATGKAAAAPPAPPAASAASAEDTEPDEFALPKISDPLEPFNRAMFKFNDGFYAVVLRPVAHGYERAVPEGGRHGLANFFENVKFPVRFVGDLLAGRPKRAAQETGKFVLNTTVGFAGLVRVSDSVPALAEVPTCGVGTAFAAWGIKPGPYLVLPLYGPNDVRDTVGLVGDYYLLPVNWNSFQYVHGYRWQWNTAIETLDVIQSSPATLRQYDDFMKSALDPYIAVRNAYLQYRENAVKK
jgi:phospholipid-binding lipoprotein MlaA